MRQRIKLEIKGAVQGVGFRPFVYRLANELNLNGYVLNSTIGVIIECEGERKILEIFIDRIKSEKPKLAFISSFEYSFLEPKGYETFEILHSRYEAETVAFILPDISTCPDCLKEMFDPKDRRYMYPFINCTNCGPRYSIIESLPYDRSNTTMKKFQMCSKCREEYNNPNDRRYHAQPIACPECGPHVELWDREGNVLSKKHDAIEETVELIKKGKIIALKGIGGFQLLVDSYNDEAVKKLRERKHRIDKPFALMFPNLDSVYQVCNLELAEERLLLSPEAPIVLLKRKSTPNTKQPSTYVAPENPYLGIMLPYSPLHHIIMNELNIPIVATSGNISEEPMCIDELEALDRLQNIADFFLVHNRPIARYVDDSVARVIKGKVMMLRRARGYAPFPIEFEENIRFDDKTLLAVGGQLKNTIALQKGKNVFISQHIGDLSNEKAINSFKKAVKEFQEIYKSDSSIFICDLHPDYFSTQFVNSLNNENKKVIYIQHHIAHAASCIAENQVKNNALAVVWDGTGFGLDGTIWGGEFFLVKNFHFEHFASFRKFSLPGGEQAIKEPRRSALSLLWEIYRKELSNVKIPFLELNFSHNELRIFTQMLENNLNTPRTSSVGRIFDAVASLVNLCHRINFEGQAAMMLEFTANSHINENYPFEIEKAQPIIIDWQPIIEGILEDIKSDTEVGRISAKFHNTLSEIILKLAKLVGNETTIVLSGGCFQNAYLLERTINRLEENQFKVAWHQRVPPNDGGISFGQIASANWFFNDKFET
ncbi:MAG: carbamoyltransferase HypF [Ignavibacteria bacterium]|nr:carbamoyltransferase HypF [Ignavibacteria bacterium]